MNKLVSAFAKGKAFIPFITVGDPSLAVTERLLPAIAEAGADLIAVGLPFSDPVAEGPVVQQADLRALNAGATTDKIFAMLERVSPKADVPIALTSYINPVFTYGTSAFMQRCAGAGVCALIVPDVPFEEKQELEPYCKEYGIAQISMITPGSNNRIKRIATAAEGFLYGVLPEEAAGQSNQLEEQAAGMLQAARAASQLPCAVSLDAPTPAQARQMAQVADGIIAGTSLVSLVAEYKEDCVKKAAAFVRQMKQAICG